MGYSGQVAVCPRDVTKGLRGRPSVCAVPYCCYAILRPTWRNIHWNGTWLWIPPPPPPPKYAQRMWCANDPFPRSSLPVPCSHSSFPFLVQCCFTATGTIRLIRDGESRTATSTFTQLLSYVELNVLGCRVDILGTNCDQCVSMVQCCFTSTETIRLIRTGSPGRPPRLSHSSWTRIPSQSRHNILY